MKNVVVIMKQKLKIGDRAEDEAGDEAKDKAGDEAQDEAGDEAEDEAMLEKAVKDKDKDVVVLDEVMVEDVVTGVVEEVEEGGN